MQNFQDRSLKNIFPIQITTFVWKYRITIISLLKIFIMYFERQLEKEFFLKHSGRVGVENIFHSGKLMAHYSFYILGQCGRKTHV